MNPVEPAAFSPPSSPFSALLDASGVAHSPAGPAARIVSLVPSLTELLFELGLGDQVVGRTGFCIHPRAQLRTVEKVGGTKDVKLERVRALEPTHLIVNMDENRRETVDELAAIIPHIIVTHPNTPRDNLALYRLLGGIFGCEARAAQFEPRRHVLQQPGAAGGQAMRADALVKAQGQLREAPRRRAQQAPQRRVAQPLQPGGIEQIGQVDVRQRAQRIANGGGRHGHGWMHLRASLVQCPTLCGT